MSKYKVGDKVVMEITDKISVMEEPWYVLSNATSIYEPYLNEAAESLSTYIEQARAEGQNEAWELARKIVISTNHEGYSIEELNKIFGDRLPYSILANHNYPEAAAKVAQWEKAKENKRFDESCDTCKFESTDPYFDPCFACRHRYLSKYEPKAGEQK